MNLELIRKYEKEFLHMLHGGKVLMGKKDPITNTTKWYPSVLNPFVETSDTTVVVINDEYCTYRKALADGKTIQYMNSNCEIKSLDEWDNIGWKQFKGCVENYRIKLEEPKFKVGDWVENITCTSPRIIKKVVKAPEGYDTVTVGNSDVGINVMLINDLELWQPKPGEWCWFWDIDSNPTLCQYSKYINGEYEALTINPKYKLQGLFGFCEPFIGIVPTNMKDNKCLH